MQPFPHTYRAATSCDHESNPVAAIAGTDPLQCAPPPEFGGPGGYWTPENLLLASVSSCFVLSFKAIARASQYEWSGIECDVTGTLDKLDRTVRFTRLALEVKLVVDEGADLAKGQRLLEKAEATCLVSNSLACERSLSCRLVESAVR